MFEGKFNPGLPKKFHSIQQYQDGTIQHEVKLTGILSTNGLSEGEGPLPDYGVLMAPHLNAQVRLSSFWRRVLGPLPSQFSFCWSADISADL